MDGNYKEYDYVASSERIDAILKQPKGQFQETESLPDRDRLTFTNGFYSYCTAVFIDIRDSSALTNDYTRPVLAKIYRAFISEMVAALNDNVKVREVNIVGDCVWAVYNTPTKGDIADAFTTAVRANTLLKLLNKHYKKNNLNSISIGVGMDYGRALMIKAGFNGSKINDVIYMGDVVNRAAHLAHKAGRGYASPIWLGEIAYGNLTDPDDQSLLTRSYDNELGYVYTGNAILRQMNAWIKDNV